MSVLSDAIIDSLCAENRFHLRPQLKPQIRALQGRDDCLPELRAIIREMQQNWSGSDRVITVLQTCYISAGGDPSDVQKGAS